jgi:thymidylate kinase
VRVTYLERAGREPVRFRVIDAGAAIEDVEAAVRGALEPLAGASP